jgi:nucleotide-binding universal stress UspA family protein
MRILVAVDESEHSERAVRYVGGLLRGMSDAKVMLFHVLKPMPRKFLEHGGSENPSVEGRLGDQLRKDQDEWSRKERGAESPILLKLREVLEQTGFPPSRVTLKFGHEDDVARNILEEVREGRYETIVLGRHGAAGQRRWFGGGVTEQVLRDASGLAVWIVD